MLSAVALLAIGLGRTPEGGNLANDPVRVDSTLNFLAAKLPLSGKTTKYIDPNQSAKLPIKFLGTKCNHRSIPVDDTGRPTGAECRDITPGAFHVLLGNLIGLRGQAFVEDRTASDEVWNRSVSGYKVSNGVQGKLKEVTRFEAIRLTGADLMWTQLLPATPVGLQAWKTGKYAAPQAGSLVFRMSGTGDADLYVRKGAAPTLSLYDVKSDRSGSSEEATITVRAGETIFWGVYGHAATPSVRLIVGRPRPNSLYPFNAKAARFFHVRLDLDYLMGPPKSNPDEQTRADHYEYVLEADSGGKIIGGEWVGLSRTHHPDFLWWPR